ncbi:MAG: SDR family NAD(P)-dependent oxidoreductase [Spirochaetes bacterium]|jgi:short-subunit dehydrogenase|nr:SDR family NAD(P)-dependent oxidoreductase [Spirochaetota bacterium]
MSQRENQSGNASVMELKSQAGIDVLVNIAGYGLMGQAIDVPHEDMIQQFDTNLFGAPALIKKVAPTMNEKNTEDIESGPPVYVYSDAGEITTVLHGQYPAKKNRIKLNPREIILFSTLLQIHKLTINQTETDLPTNTGKYLFSI